MIWVINGLIYGFFTALYTLVNQKYKMNGYLLGIWRGFGISILFAPFLILYPVPQDAYYWFLLIAQGWLIGFYDSHLFFASANFGAGPTSRIMALTAIFTTVLWWISTPNEFLRLMENGTVFMTLLLVLCGFSYSYWYMNKSPISKAVAKYMMPVVLALSTMSIITKDIALGGDSVWSSVTYYLVVSTFVSGCYNTYFYIIREKPSFSSFFQEVFSKTAIKAGFYVVSFSAILITAKTLALRVAPNPGYVMALVLTAPLFVFALNKYHKIPDNVSVKAGFSMIFFLILLLFLVNGNYGVVD